MIVHSPDSAYAREMVKWEARDGVLGQAQRPYVYREYPLMVHKAGVLSKGGIDIVLQEIVNSDAERARMEKLGFRKDPLEAIRVLTGEQDMHAELAAERNFEVLRMSPRAQAEVARKEEEAGAVHLPTILETPHGLRGTPVKLSAEDVDRTVLENAEETIAAQQAELAALRLELDAAKTAATPKKRQGWPKGKPRGKKAPQPEETT